MTGPLPKKIRPRISPRPDLTGARGTSARAAISSYVVTTAAAVKLLAAEPQDRQRAPLVRQRAGRVNDQFFLREKLKCPVAFHVNGVPEAAVNCWKHGHDRAALVDVGCIIDHLAD